MLWASDQDGAVHADSSETTQTHEGQPSPDAHGQEGQEESFSLLTGHFSEAIWTVVSFCLLLIVLWRLAWKPLLTALQSREEYIQKQIKDAEKVKVDAQDVLKGYRDKLAEAEQEGRAIVSRHVKQAEQDAHDLTEKARNDIEAMKLKLETDIQRAQREAQKELLEQSADIILNLGREILGRSINTDDNQRLIDEAIARMEVERENPDEQNPS
jgi:F-type H+-transporting ATPase subunit b